MHEILIDENYDPGATRALQDKKFEEVIRIEEEENERKKKLDKSKEPSTS